jgi:DNA-binding NarL/FixJ family response regulator
MLGRDDEYVTGLERAQRAYLDGGDVPRAVRCAFWIGHNMLFRGETARATGWFGRAKRLLEREQQDCVEHGYLLIPVWLAQMAGDDWAAGYATAAEAAEIGERFGDPDLVWLARDEQGRALVNWGRVGEGLRLVDEALVVAAAGELSPIVTGIVYCNTIAFCRDAYQLRQAGEWTEALTQWCERQPEMVAHLGLCLVHRAEIMQLRGAWGDAMDEAARAAERFTAGVLNQLACGKARYRQGDIHRLRGELADAEQAYRDASRHGHEPQPGLALLRLAEGNTDAAAGTIRRAVGESTRPLRRAGLLPAYVEIMIASGELERAGAACRELAEIAASHASEALEAMAAQASGAVALAEGDAQAALAFLRRAAQVWQEHSAVYETARARALVGVACRALDDEDGATLELDAARDAFSLLGAKADLARVDALTSNTTSVDVHGLTDRELEVLRLVAAGKSNREIGAELVISEHTVRRHLQNIFAKLGVSSRTAASTFAFTHGLI